LGRSLLQAALSGSSASSAASGEAVMLLMIFSSVFEKPLTMDMITAAR
jgi:hypothetical protein